MQIQSQSVLFQKDIAVLSMQIQSQSVLCQKETTLLRMLIQNQLASACFACWKLLSYQLYWQLGLSPIHKKKYFAEGCLLVRRAERMPGSVFGQSSTSEASLKSLIIMS
ncbi:hypothetical protein PoB_003306300 [Plakobranchus ocellatus]|uniref:Uncharacterized protein n=1 Tax=Plakobranchus ocellatus TaxID=259542 RepID=A0AAV4AID6_9GAST|nr:hypothetical protein PoB_003306300 [Plakobranchus ocellatus]